MADVLSKNFFRACKGRRYYTYNSAELFSVLESVIEV
jgi:hypothetical protein